MKGIWMIAVAAMLVISTGCAKKETDTLTQMDMGQEVTGVAKGDETMTDTIAAEDLGDTTIAEPLDMGSSSMGSGMDSASAADAIIARLQDVHFDFDRAVVRDQDKPALMANANLLKGNPNIKVSVEGHADARGTTAYNLALGERRAVATRRYLEALGVSPSQLVTVSYGEEKPLCTMASESCWSKNRRVHLSAAN